MLSSILLLVLRCANPCKITSRSETQLTASQKSEATRSIVHLIIFYNLWLFVCLFSLYLNALILFSWGTIKFAPVKSQDEQGFGKLGSNSANCMLQKYSDCYKRVIFGKQFSSGDKMHSYQSNNQEGKINLFPYLLSQVTSHHQCTKVPQHYTNQR